MNDRPFSIKDQKPKSKDQLAAIILAAGRSKRMGAFKPLLPFGDKTVIRSCLDNLRAAGVEEIVIVVGHRAEDLRSHLETAGVTFVTNPNPDSEMSISIALGIAGLSANSRAVLITPADHPAVPPQTIRELIEKWRGGAKLIQPEFEGKGGHPVLIDLSYRDELTNLNEKFGLRGFFMNHAPEVLRLAVK